MPRKKQSSARPSSRRGYGWEPDLPDHRDHVYAAPLAITTRLPVVTDLRAQCPPIYDQGELGSCTANAIGAAQQFDQRKQQIVPVFQPSRLFIYYNERALEGTVRSDSGAQIRDGVKSIAQRGVCPETMWPYVVAKFAVKPPPTAYGTAQRHAAVSYRRIARTLPQMKGCLAEGYPFVFGFTVYESFESPAVAQTGRVPMPRSTETVLGGHAVLAVGYDDRKLVFVVRNSWGTGWGLKGYCTMPYAYLLDADLSDDFWTVRQVE